MQEVMSVGEDCGGHRSIIDMEWFGEKNFLLRTGTCSIAAQCQGEHQVPRPVMPASNVPSTVGYGGEITIEASEEMTRRVLRDHGGPDIMCLQEQTEKGRVEPAVLEAAWAGQRTEILRWLSGMFDYYMLQDEWFFATVALLDRAEAARPRFSARNL